MKKSVLIVLAFLTFTSGYAQDPERTKVDFGIKGGVNITGIAGEYSRDIQTAYKISLHGGIFASAPIIRDKVGLQLEALFSAKGYKADVEDTDTLNNATVRNSIVHNQFWLDVPLIVQFFPGSGWELHGGVQYSILLLEQYVNFAPSRKEKITVSNTDFGILIGAAYKLDARNKVGARYIYGLDEIMNFDGSSAHSSLFQVYVGFAFF